MLMMGIMLIGVFNVFLPVETCVASGNTIYVDDSGGADYTNIQDAVNAANDSDTIYVYSGTYNENIYINKSLKLYGLGSSTKPRINGQHTHKSTVEVMADNVNISNFDIYNPGQTASYHGIAIGKTQESMTDQYNISILNCYITECSIGILLRGGGHWVVKNCEIYETDGEGIKVIGAQSEISNNIISKCNYGIILSYSEECLLSNNDIYLNYEDGIRLQSSSNSNTIKSNKITNNIGWGVNVYLSNCNNNIFYLNDFNDNGENGQDKGNNQWYYNNEGNYWSDYDGVDENPEDNIGDTPHTIPGGSNKDDYPLGYWLNSKPTAINPPESQENQKPTATIIKPSPTTPTTATSGESIYFHGIGTDSDGTIVEYIWRSSKDGVFNENSTFTKSDLSVGTHAIYFKVKDNQGEWSSEDTAILVINTSSSPSNEPPTPDTGGPYTGYVNAAISFDASNSSDPDGDDIVSYEWDFGDGNGNGVSVEHTYSSIGNYTVTLTVTDSQDKTSTISTYANIVVQTTVQPPDQNDDNGDDTPGFEIFMAIIAISLILFLKRRK